MTPIRQGVREHFGSFTKSVARGLSVRHDHGSQYMSRVFVFQDEIAFLGAKSSPAFVRPHASVGSPEVISGQVVMLPSEWGKVCEQRVRHDVAAETDGIERAAEVDRVPQDDRRRDQGEAARAVSLGLGGAIVKPSEAVEADSAHQGIMALALVELCRGLPLERRLL